MAVVCAAVTMFPVVAATCFATEFTLIAVNAVVASLRLFTKPLAVPAAS